MKNTGFLIFLVLFTEIYLEKYHLTNTNLKNTIFELQI